MRTHFKPTETFQYTNLYSCHPPGVTKGFIKGEALRLLRTNSSEITFEENMRNFSTRLKNKDYPATTVEKHLSEVIVADRKKALEQRNKYASKKIVNLKGKGYKGFKTKLFANCRSRAGQSTFKP